MAELFKFVNEETGREFTARIVFQNDAYGLDDRLIHKEGEPLIEVYDRTSAKKMVERGDEDEILRERGHFASRYYFSTFVRGSSGISLHGDVPEWKITAKNRKDISNWAWDQWLYRLNGWPKPRSR